MRLLGWIFVGLGLLAVVGAITSWNDPVPKGDELVERAGLVFLPLMLFVLARVCRVAPARGDTGVSLALRLVGTAIVVAAVVFLGGAIAYGFEETEDDFLVNVLAGSLPSLLLFLFGWIFLRGATHVSLVEVVASLRPDDLSPLLRRVGEAATVPAERMDRIAGDAAALRPGGSKLWRLRARSGNRRMPLEMRVRVADDGGPDLFLRTPAPLARELDHVVDRFEDAAQAEDG